MLNKKGIYEYFQRFPDRYWKIDIFEKEGYERKVCEKCNKGFWTLQQRKYCPEHDIYGFIRKPITKVKWNFFDGWKNFEKFFKKNGHRVIKRYPVVSRWHPNLFFTIASIQDFIRIDASGLNFEYPHNPLIVPQISLRFNDIENVGVTGKHMTCFLMGGQHAFNDESGKGYWKDRCIELNFKFFTKVMGIPKEELVYLEDVWAMPDFSAFGPTIETFSRGLELVNHVFMEFTKENSSYRELPIKVIDTGWGFERLLWFSQGSPTVYEVAFGDVIEKLKKETQVEYDEQFFDRYAIYAGQLNIEEAPDIKVARNWVANQLKIPYEDLDKKVAPLEALYAIADHSRTLAFAIADGALPSNVGGGYNLRVILRRALSFIDKFNWSINLEEVSIWHAEYLKKMFPEILESQDEIMKILQVEKNRYKQKQQRVSRIIESLDKRTLSEEDLTKLYESEGISPEQLGIEVPSKFYKNITEKHMGAKSVQKTENLIDVSKIPPTKILYYEYPPIYNFKAKILKLYKNYVVLDQTAFYPESGGQKADQGYIAGSKVLDVKKIGNVIVHQIEDELKAKVGEEVICDVDKNRREILTKHHDAIHIISGAARKVLGKHIHQYGAEKDVDKARIDLTHFDNLNDEEVEKIESLANKIALKNLPIKKFIMKRGEAEIKYGFDIYAGGYVPSKEIRIVDIGNGFDVEACGGTHGNKTKDVFPIVITKVKRVADGLVRIEIKASSVAVEFLKEKEKILSELSSKLKVKEKDVPKAVQDIFQRWKYMRKKLKSTG